MTTVLVPPYPGVWSAFGLLTSNYTYDHSRSVVVPLGSVEEGRLVQLFDELEDQGRAKLVAAGFDPNQTTYHRYAELRYRGQSFEIRCPYPDPKALLPDRAIFDRLHAQEYGFSNPNEPLELVNVGVVAEGEVPPVVFPELLRGSQEPPNEAVKDERKLCWAGQWWDVPVYERPRLMAGNQLFGPCVVEQDDTTTVVLPHWRGEVLANGHLKLTYGPTQEENDS